MNPRNHVKFAMLTVLALSLGCDAISPDANANRLAQPAGAGGQQRPEGDNWAGKLKAGVALPQTLPDGTQVGFSVDYQFRSYEPNPHAQYVWEIRMGDGSIERLIVQIAGKRGTLSQFLPVRPEAGPFTSRICAAQGEEGELTPLTDWTSMQ